MIPFPKFDNETNRLIFWLVLLVLVTALVVVAVITDALDVDALWGLIVGTLGGGGAARAATKSDKTPL